MVAKAVEALLVEDNPSDVELTLHTLRRHSLANRAHVLRDGAEALDFLYCQNGYAGRDPASAPNVVLLDPKLPKVDGLEVLRQVRAHEKACMFPIVIMTSSREERGVVVSYRLGANGYVVKPVDIGQFSEAVRQLGCYWLLVNHPPTP